MNENILITNVHSSKNLGDAALLQVTLQQLEASFPGCEITISMDDPASHSGGQTALDSLVALTHPKQADGSVKWNYGHLLWLLPASLIPIITQKLTGKTCYAFTPKHYRPILEAYRKADIIVSGPGGFLYSSGRGISLLLTIFSIALGVMASKPVYLFPQSIGPLRHAWEKTLLRWLLSRVRIVMVREPISCRVATQLGLKKGKLLLVPDMAFALPGANREAGREWLERHEIDLQNRPPLMGMTIINWGEQHGGFDHQVEYETACAETIRWFITQAKGKVILFPQVFGPYASQDDRVPARRVAESLKGLTDSIITVEEPIPLEQLKSIYAWMDVLIGTRMHSNIFALSEDVPVIMIGYLPKTRGMAVMFGIEEWCVDIGESSGKELISRLQKYWAKRVYWPEGKEEEFLRMISSTKKVGAWVHEDYLAWERKAR